MKTLTFVVITFLTIFASQVYSQSNIDWGESVFGVQLSIAVSNNLVVAGTNTTLQCRIKNASTNNIASVVHMMLPDATHLFLISSSGKISELTHTSTLGSAMLGDAVKASETYEWLKSFEVSTNIEPGEYKIEATRYIYSINGTNHQAGKLVSNLLKVQIK
jgi:hypothetical protein